MFARQVKTVETRKEMSYFTVLKLLKNIFKLIVFVSFFAVIGTMVVVFVTVMLGTPFFEAIQTAEIIFIGIVFGILLLMMGGITF
ncbi:TPA: hypothetical protein U1B12_001063 [Streptococcus suis]|uniref:hypothetical protein n=1 Tax=Streptococcus suis TaxID=1307 RepID=UPI000CF45A7F|nr:hypothetical protein [Streptococcus suis]MCO8200841.1 hypothetical protein [Streptococcus suis]MCO8218378.1 hypothetical protein [Streptococcus suis]HEM3467928.1 hypothetical protein [Streptococcus suis]HEM3478639.1 hypothetical protein [Streptococcus suis]